MGISARAEASSCHLEPIPASKVGIKRLELTKVDFPAAFTCCSDSLRRSAAPTHTHTHTETRVPKVSTRRRYLSSLKLSAASGRYISLVTRARTHTHGHNAHIHTLATTLSHTPTRTRARALLRSLPRTRTRAVVTPRSVLGCRLCHGDTAAASRSH